MDITKYVGLIPIRPNRSTAAGDRRVGLLGHRDVQRARRTHPTARRARQLRTVRAGGAPSSIP